MSLACLGALYLRPHEFFIHTDRETLKYLKTQTNLNKSVTPTVRLSLPRVGARLRGIAAW